MNLTIYRKEFSIFIYNENIQLARYLKDALAQRGYEAHFYSSENLLKQAIYLALPHIVVLPYGPESEALVDGIRKISREIQIFMVGEAADYEAIHALSERKWIYDYLIDPIKFISAFAHRIDLGAEKWLISLRQEQPAREETAAGPLQNLEFIEDPEITPTADSLISDLLEQNSDETAVRFCLTQLQKICGKNYVYLKYDAQKELFTLTDVASGFSSQHQNMGFKLEQVRDRVHFFQKPQEHRIWTEFFSGVFSTTQTEAFLVRGHDIILGFVVSLGSLTEADRLLSQRLVRATTLFLENTHKSRIIFDHIPIELKSYCLNSKHFYNRLTDEVSRARRLQLPLSTVCFEIRTKDAGMVHQTAQLMAKILKRFTRVTDFAGRVSEKRLVLAMPHTSQENATTKAGSLLGIIKAAIEEKKWQGVDVGGGVSEYPRQATDSMSLLAGSEEAAEQSGEYVMNVYQTQEDTGADLV